MVWESTGYEREWEQLKGMFIRVHSDSQSLENVAKASQMLSGSRASTKSNEKKSDK